MSEFDLTEFRPENIFKIGAIATTGIVLVAGLGLAAGLLFFNQNKNDTIKQPNNTLKNEKVTAYSLK